MKKILAFLVMCICVRSLAYSQMKIHVIDVGQADSILLEFKSAAVLVDAGGESTGDDRDKDHLQTAPLRADVTGRRGPIGAQFLLHEEIPLLNVAVLVINGEAARAAIEARVLQVRTDRLNDRIHSQAVERSNDDSGRRRPISALRNLRRRRRRECPGGVEARPVIEAGVGRHIGQAVSAAHHNRVGELVSRAQTRAEVLVVGDRKSVV